ncbi:MAG: cadherin-like beta sandwich domain-containing protein [Firmicutes bacterium]|nr:cadherin-like beta sandwich domain-containing protein [Bacillota bacterium]
MKKISMLFIFCIGLLFLPLSIKAASFSVSASSYNVPVGSTVTVYVKGSDLTGRVDVSSSNNSIFSGGGYKWIENDTVSFKFTAKTAGSVTITVAPAKGTANSSGQIVNLSSKTIILKSYIPRALSSDNYLSSLSVDGVELVPSFDKDTTGYIVDLEPGTTSINVDATKANKYASVSGTGKISVKEGSNEINVVVTAENGAKKTYTITAVVKEYAPINVTLGNRDFTVVRKKEELIKPEYYNDTTIKIGEDYVPGFYNERTGYYLIGLKDVTGSVELYSYNATKKTYSSYTSLEFNKMNLIILEVDESKLPKGFEKDSITLNKKVITCYKNYELGITLIYGKSIITGEENFYAYENTDLTIQKFNNDAYDKLNEKIQLYSYMIVGLGSLILLILICLIISKIVKKVKLKNKKSEIEKTMNIDINKIKKEAKKDKNLEKLKKQQEKELKKAEKEKKKLEAKIEKQNKKRDKKQKNKEKDDNMFYL